MFTDEELGDLHQILMHATSTLEGKLRWYIEKEFSPATIKEQQRLLDMHWEFRDRLSKWKMEGSLADSRHLSSVKPST